MGSVVIDMSMSLDGYIAGSAAGNRLLRLGQRIWKNDRQSA
jgi:hypothetical protein